MSAAGARGLIIAAPASASGKTLVTIGLASAFSAEGRVVAAAKAGPDYIDTAFLAAATRAPAVNLDAWAMRPGLIDALVARVGAGADLVLVEGVMGLFDGTTKGAGSTAALARCLALPVVLVIDASRQAQSAAALAHGFASFDPGVQVAGVILNRVAGARHEALLREAFAGAGIRVFGCLPRAPAIALPSRHLGLVQAGETARLDAVITAAGDLARAHLDLTDLGETARPLRPPSARRAPIRPPGQRIALARDAAFGFVYEHLVAGWREAGVEIVPFSPLADQPPDAAADAVWLPGGYPELYAGRLSASDRFLAGLVAAADRGAAVHGECGGYMVLGRGLVDASGTRHPMVGLLNLETSFAAPRLRLGYRRARVVDELRFATAGAWLRGHEFHYAAIVREVGEPVFSLSDPSGDDLGREGLRAGTVTGSFIHLIDAE